MDEISNNCSNDLWGMNECLYEWMPVLNEYYNNTFHPQDYIELILL